VVDELDQASDDNAVVVLDLLGLLSILLMREELLAGGVAVIDDKLNSIDDAVLDSEVIRIFSFTTVFKLMDRELLVDVEETVESDEVVDVLRLMLVADRSDSSQPARGAGLGGRPEKSVVSPVALIATVVLAKAANRIECLPRMMENDGRRCYADKETNERL